MIPSELKLGDRFIDGNREFEVIGTSSLGYVSKFIGFVDKTAEPIKETVIKEDNPDYESMGIRTLQDICRDKGLTIRGSKSELIERLKSAK